MVARGVGVGVGVGADAMTGGIVGLAGRTHARGTSQVVTVTPANGTRGSPHGALMVLDCVLAPVRGSGAAAPPSTGMATTREPDGRNAVVSPR